MVKRKITPLLLAATMLVSGISGSFLNAQSASAITRVDELSDIKQSNWAYDTLKDLVEKYNVVEGYPDKTFRGAKNASRYELAAALDATIKTIGKDIARLGAEKADKEDLAKVARLQQEFSAELSTLQAKTAALEGRATKIEAKNDEQDNRLAILQKMKIYGDASFGGISDFGGFNDALSTVGRTRLNVDYDIVEDKGGKVVGPGVIHSRVVAAFGRVAPLNSNSATATNASLFSGYSRIAADASGFNEGIRTSSQDFVGISGSNLRANAYVDSIYYSQNLKAKLFCNEDFKTSFNIHAGLIPWRDIFFQSPYQGNENTQFQNSALINNPAVFQDNNTPRLVAEMKQGLGKYANLSAKAEVSSLNIADVQDGISTTAELDLGYNLGFLNKMFCTNIFDHSGNLFGGYYFVHSPGSIERLAIVNPVTGTAGALGAVSDTGARGFYVGGNQEIYKGLGIFGNYALNNGGSLSSLLSALQNNTGRNIILNSSIANGGGTIAAPSGVSVYGVRQAWTLGGEIPLRVLPDMLTFGGKRAKDTIGVAYSQITPLSNFGANPSLVSAERILETYYRLQVNDGFALIPSFQFISDREGNKANKAAVAVGLRTSFSF